MCMISKVFAWFKKKFEMFWNVQRNFSNSSWNKVLTEVIIIFNIVPSQNDEQSIMKKINSQNVRLTNQWIVSYNSKLFFKYQVYINVEICVIIQIIKYIHKYVYKKSDHVTTIFWKNFNVIVRYYQNR